MKLEFVEMAGFRGVREKVRYEFGAGFTVVTGRNGVGKSTVFDAIDFALTGSINKYAVSSAKGGGLADHIWWVGDEPANEHLVTVGFISDQGEKIEVTKSRGHSDEQNIGLLLQSLCGPRAGSASMSDLVRATLIRDELIAAFSIDMAEQARFATVRDAVGASSIPDYSRRTDAIQKVARASFEEATGQAEDISLELGRALSALTDARTDASRSSDIAAATATVVAAVGNSGGRPLVELARRELTLRKSAVEIIERVLPQLDAWTRAGGAQRLLELQKLRDAAESRASDAAELLASKRGVEADRRGELALIEGEDEHTTHLAAIVRHGEALGLVDHHCPLCDAERSDEQFQAAIESAKRALADRHSQIVAATDAADRAASEAEAARVVAEQTDNYLTDAADAYAKHVEARRSIDDSLRSLGLTDPGNLDSDRLSALLAERRAALAELSSAHQTLELSGAVERVASLEKEVANLRRSSDVVAAKVADAQRRFELAKQIDSATRAVANEISIEQFETVMPLLKELYRRLRPHNEWTEINSEFGGKVRASLNFTVGNGKNPQFLFSSGQRRAAGLAFLLAVHLSRPWCQWRSILLDDPVQHVDDYRALNLVEVLSAIRRSGRQVVIAVEDPSLADLLCRRLRSSSAEPGVRIDLDAGLELPRIHMISPMPKSILSLRATG